MVYKVIVAEKNAQNERREFTVYGDSETEAREKVETLSVTAPSLVSSPLHVLEVEKVDV